MNFLLRWLKTIQYKIVCIDLHDAQLLHNRAAIWRLEGEEKRLREELTPHQGEVK